MNQPGGMRTPPASNAHGTSGNIAGSSHQPLTGSLMSNVMTLMTASTGNPIDDQSVSDRARVMS